MTLDKSVNSPVSSGSCAEPRPRWHEVLRTEPAKPRPLTLPELQRLTRLGFSNLAMALAAGTCPACGLNKAGTGHRQLCVEPAQAQNPVSAPAEVRQPWEPRPSRRAA